MLYVNECVLGTLNGKSGDKRQFDDTVIIGYHDVTVVTGFNGALPQIPPIVCLIPSGGIVKHYVFDKLITAV